MWCRGNAHLLHAHSYEKKLLLRKRAWRGQENVLLMMSYTRVCDSAPSCGVNSKIGETYLGERLSERLSFTRFCASGR